MNALIYFCLWRCDERLKTSIFELIKERSCDAVWGFQIKKMYKGMNREISKNASEKGRGGGGRHN